MQVALKPFEVVFEELGSDFDRGPASIRSENLQLRKAEVATNAIDQAFGRATEDGGLETTDFLPAADPMTFAKRAIGDGDWKSCGSYSWRFAEDENGQFVQAKLNKSTLCGAQSVQAATLLEIQKRLGISQASDQKRVPWRDERQSECSKVDPELEGMVRT